VKPHKIFLKNVKVHNLKNISIEFQTQELIVLTGVSGSGKSSIAFDTLYTEGQRRYVESLSNYLKKQMGGLPKPEAESIEGITPTIAIEQKSVSKNPRSTVATLTGIQDFLRIIFSKIAIPYCPISQERVKPQSIKEILFTIKKLPIHSKWILLAPFIVNKKGAFKEDLKELQRKGYIRIMLDGDLRELTQDIELDKQAFHTIEVVIDRITIDPDQESRLLDSIEQALNFKDQTFSLYSPESKEKIFFSTLAFSQGSGVSYAPLEPQDFSYNHPKGMCESCEGLGVKMEFDLSKLIDPKKSLKEGFCAFMGDYETVKWGNIYENLAEIYRFSTSEPYENLTKEQQAILLYGTEKKWTKMEFFHPVKKTRWTEFVQWKGILHDIKTRYEEASSSQFKEEIEKFMDKATCQGCKGSRLKPYPSAARLSNRTYHEICELPLEACLDFFDQLFLTPFEKELAEGLIQEIQSRLKFLLQVGLEYLSLYRSAPTLSGGEAQRIRLASQIGSGLIGTTFVLDEPSIGLHPQDNKKLIETLKALKNQGNTVIVVEHDEDTILAADRIIDVGPKAGIEGGEILCHGTIQDLLLTKNSLTSAFLRGDDKIKIPEKRRSSENFLHLYKASYHNLKKIDVAIPLHNFVAITGVSGSGKSSLILGTLYPALSNILSKTTLPCGPYEKIDGIHHLKKVIAIDQTPIGRTPRSNPLTYVKIFDEIRELFASTKEAQSLGFDSGRFSFNVKEGSCHQCLGMGVIKMDMDFLEEEILECPLCEGKRFDPQTLSIKFKDKSIYDILEMSIKEALLFFENIPTLHRKLQFLEHVGLGYMKLGQPSTTLSGGEAQRIKLAKELIRPSSGGTIYILDEPTTGLHFSDIEKLLGILNHLVDKGNTVLVIEHNMDLVKTADFLIDLGPKGGESGGLIMGVGTPEMIATQSTPTGIALKEALELNRKERTKKLLKQKPHQDFFSPIKEIVITGAKEHNLKNLSLSIPRNAITVFTGPSGSGKSSLAFDTLYAEGQRRYVESLSPYLRQFIDTMPKPHVEWIDGLSPAIALDQGRVLKNPRSTIGTMTEAYDYLRILYAKEGKAYSPETQEEIKPISLYYVHQKILSDYQGKKLIVLAPIKSHGLASIESLQKELLKLGFLKIKLNSTYYEIEEVIPYNPKMKNSIKIVIDRLQIKKEMSKRLYESLEKAKEIGKDELYLDIEGEEKYFHLAFACESTGQSYPLITPKSFLFNAVDGMCLDCLGLGFQYGSIYLIKEAFFSLTPLDILYLFFKENTTKMILKPFIKAFNELEVDIDIKLSDMPSSMLEKFLKGDKNSSCQLEWIGLEKTIDRLAMTGTKEIKEFFQPFLTEVTCPSCLGSRLNPLSSNVRFNGLKIQEATALSIEQLFKKIDNFSYTANSTTDEVISQLKKRLKFLIDIGLSYLSLDRKAPSLSGGELQRIRLSKQIGASLSGCLYVLDEPTIGLHPHNNALLNQALIQLKNLNNTVVLVEHDPMTIEIADHIVDFGKGAGIEGGEILAQGTYDSILKNPDSVTGLYLSKKLLLPKIVSSKKERGSIKIFDAQCHNLKGINVQIPLGKLTCITGVSGSGKSTLLEEVIYKNIHGALHQSNFSWIHASHLEGLEGIEKISYMEQGALGQTSRADISTYTDLLTPLRTFFSSLKEAKIRGLQPKNFSFNHQKGMCKTCEGHGVQYIDLKFMAQVKVTCPDCEGYRLNPMSLKVTYENKHLGQILDLSVNDLEHHLPPIPKVIKIIEALKSVGLGYLKLSQEINTLSGGEAQRLKLSKELVKQASGKTIFLFDEPSTGLHYKDLALLIKVLENLLKKGATCVMVEHNLDLLKVADHVIDLGPDGGEFGGEVVYEGNLENLLKCQKSHTAHYLKNHCL
jgi:excinuclease ABC subunit A